MNLKELAAEVARKKALGHDYIQIKIRRDSAPRNWDRVRVMPGVYGKCIGKLYPGAWMVDCPLASVERALEKRSGE